MDIQPTQCSLKLMQTYPSGAEEWLCLSCGYHIVMQYYPKHRWIVLAQGNGKPHPGGTGEIDMNVQAEAGTG